MFQSLKKAIQNRRMGLLGDLSPEEMDERKDANMNPDEGSQDDLSIALDDNEGADGEDIQQNVDGMAPATTSSREVDQEGNMSPGMSIDKFFAKDDVGKPGIRGKAAALMQKAMMKK